MAPWKYWSLITPRSQRWIRYCCCCAVALSNSATQCYPAGFPLFFASNCRAPRCGARCEPADQEYLTAVLSDIPSPVVDVGLS